MNSPLSDLKLKYKNDKGTMRRLELIEQEFNELETELGKYREISKLFLYLLFGDQPIEECEWPDYSLLDPEDKEVISERQWEIMKELIVR